MIDTILVMFGSLSSPTGLDILTNVQKGHVYGRMANWGAGKRRQFGVYLLHKAYLCYLLDPPQPVGQHDF